MNAQEKNELKTEAELEAFGFERHLDKERRERNRRRLQQQGLIYNAIGALLQLRAGCTLDDEVEKHLQFMIADLILLESLNWPEETKNGN